MTPAEVWVSFAAALLGNSFPMFSGQDQSDAGRMAYAAMCADLMTEQWAQRFDPDCGWFESRKARP